MQTHAMKVNAINAARRFMKEQNLAGDWNDHFFIDSLGPRQFVVQHKPVMNRDEAWKSLMVATEGAFTFPTAEYIESNRDEPLSERSAALRAFFASRPQPEPLSDDEIDAMEKQAEAAADQQQAFEHELPNGKVWVTKSVVEKPVKRVWAIADEMIAANPAVTRKEVQEECVRRGIASGTARTQYQAWSTARKNAAANAEHAATLSAKLNGK